MRLHRQMALHSVQLVLLTVKHLARFTQYKIYPEFSNKAVPLPPRGTSFYGLILLSYLPYKHLSYII